MMTVEDIRYNYSNGYISIDKHPYCDLYILNYTKKASKDAVWNEVTLNSRGLIIGKEGNIISLPFRKFFELEQLPGELIPIGKPKEIFEKLDGTLGIMYWYNNKPFISSRGSFTSFQALKATELLYRKYSDIFHLLNSNYTYLFEIIIPENRIVVDYGETEDLFLIGVINNETKNEIDIYKYQGLFNLPKKIKIGYNFSINELSDANENSEGFVIKYENGFRIKVKSKNYKSKYQFYFETIKNYALQKAFHNKVDNYIEKNLSFSDKKWLELLIINIETLKRELLGKKNFEDKTNDKKIFGIIKNRVHQNQFLVDDFDFRKNFLI